MAKLRTTSIKKISLVKIKNDLIESFIKSNNLVALKILFFIAYAYKGDTTSKMTAVTIDIKDLCLYCNIDHKTLIRNVKQMQETSISWTDDLAEHYVSVIPKVSFQFNGKMIIEIYGEVMNMICNVKNKFTTINTQQLMQLTSKHSARMVLLLEMINGFSDNVAKRKSYSLEELNALFGTNYARMGLFEQKIIIPTKKELDNGSKLSFIYDIKYDKLTSTVGRPKATGIIIDLVENRPTPKLF